MNELSKREEIAESTVNQFAIIAPQQVRMQVNAIQELMASVMKDGTHYGKVKGCGDKPSLLQPGAQKLALMFQLSPTFDIQRENLQRSSRIHSNMHAFSQERRLRTGSGSRLLLDNGECSYLLSQQLVFFGFCFIFCFLIIIYASLDANAQTSLTNVQIVLYEHIIYNSLLSSGVRAFFDNVLSQHN